MDELILGGTADVESFLERWYGSTKDLAINKAPMDTVAPFALVRWHALAGAVGTRITFQDHPIALQDLKWDADGMLTFWAENQNGCFWAVDHGDPGQIVFYRFSNRETWTATSENLEQFLLHCTVYEASIGAEQMFTVLESESRLSEALESFSELTFPRFAYEEPEAKIWASDDALARVTRAPRGYAQPGQSLWMLTFAAPHGVNIGKYAPRFEIDPDTDFVVDRTPPPHQEPPF